MDSETDEIGLMYCMFKTCLDDLSRVSSKIWMENVNRRGFSDKRVCVNVVFVGYEHFYFLTKWVVQISILFFLKRS